MSIESPKLILLYYRPNLSRYDRCDRYSHHVSDSEFGVNHFDSAEQMANHWTWILLNEYQNDDLSDESEFVVLIDGYTKGQIEDEYFEIPNREQYAALMKQITDSAYDQYKVKVKAIEDKKEKEARKQRLATEERERQQKEAAERAQYEALRQKFEPNYNCNKCWKCLEGKDDETSGLPITSTRMILCPTCRNKRCPKASDHNLKCTNSNEPGQEGSVY